MFQNEREREWIRHKPQDLLTFWFLFFDPILHTEGTSHPTIRWRTRKWWFVAKSRPKVDSSWRGLLDLHEPNTRFDRALQIVLGALLGIILGVSFSTFRPRTEIWTHAIRIGSTIMDPVIQLEVHWLREELGSSVIIKRKKPWPKGFTTQKWVFPVIYPSFPTWGDEGGDNLSRAFPLPVRLDPEAPGEPTSLIKRSELLPTKLEPLPPVPAMLIVDETSSRSMEWFPWPSLPTRTSLTKGMNTWLVDSSSELERGWTWRYHHPLETKLPLITSSLCRWPWLQPREDGGGTPLGNRGIVWSSIPIRWHQIYQARLFRGARAMIHEGTGMNKSDRDYRCILIRCWHLKRPSEELP